MKSQGFTGETFVQRSQAYVIRSSRLNTPDFMKEVQAGKKAGKSVDEVAASWKLPAKYKGYTDPTSTPAQMTRLKANVQIVFDESK